MVWLYFSGANVLKFMGICKKNDQLYLQMKFYACKMWILTKICLVITQKNVYETTKSLVNVSKTIHSNKNYKPSTSFTFLPIAAGEATT
jgi:hypothetical protein